MYLLQKSNKKASSRKQIDIRGVREGVLILRQNRYRVVLKVSSVNFELKSEDEQDALIETYESFLNSLGGKMQILIRTREIDMDKYLDDLATSATEEPELIYKQQSHNYQDFIKTLVVSNKILTRNFYVVLSYDSNSSIDFDTAKEQLNLQADIVTKGLARMGMSSSELSSLETLDLFYSFYNPEKAKVQPLTDQAFDVLHKSYVKRAEAL